MVQIEGKEKILKVAEELIVKNGYNTISARKIARDAKMSIGTLYHHFPNGKLSILYEIILSYRNEFLEDFDFSKIEQFDNPEIAKDYLITIIEQHRKFAPLIKGFEVELLTNKKLLVDLDNLIKSQEIRFEKFFTDIILRFYPDIKEPEKTFSIITRIFTTIIHTHVIFENFYGTDDDLVEILYKMLTGLIKSV
ncbi:MAG: TetR/AcrR family transcriptional regulator [Promethearchaeota archaeon]